MSYTSIYIRVIFTYFITTRTLYTKY